MFRYLIFQVVLTLTWQLIKNFLNETCSENPWVVHIQEHFIEFELRGVLIFTIFDLA